MKQAIALLFALALSPNLAHAASPHEQLKEMVAQLQKSPDDDGLRGKIIKLAQTANPASVVPEVS